ncbi:hypothetical protein J6590_026919 [Homalodisca vitripennis]|nr:hypothetical protein J6590_026919 [Homalodisca vitripennis]
MRVYATAVARHGEQSLNLQRGYSSDNLFDVHREMLKAFRGQLSIGRKWRWWSGVELQANLQLCRAAKT